MPKYRCTIRSEYVSFVDIEAEDEVEAYDLAEAYIEDGGVEKMAIGILGKQMSLSLFVSIVMSQEVWYSQYLAARKED